MAWKSPLFVSKRGRGFLMCLSKAYHSPHQTTIILSTPLWAQTPNCLSDWCVLIVIVLLNQPIKDVKAAYYLILLVLVQLFFMSVSTQYEQINSLVYYIQKTWCLHLPVRLSMLSPLHWGKQTESHPRWSIQYTLKCAYEERNILETHYGIAIIHPVAVTSAFTFVLNWKMLISKSPRTKQITPSNT